MGKGKGVFFLVYTTTLESGKACPSGPFRGSCVLSFPQSPVEGPLDPGRDFLVPTLLSILTACPGVSGAGLVSSQASFLSRPPRTRLVVGSGLLFSLYPEPKPNSSFCMWLLAEYSAVATTSKKRMWQLESSQVSLSIKKTTTSFTFLLKIGFFI